MTKLEAMRNLALNKLGWLGQYTYDELCITDQLYVDGMVENMGLQDKRTILLNESYSYLHNMTIKCPCCGFPNCGHSHNE